MKISNSCGITNERLADYSTHFIIWYRDLINKEYTENPENIDLKKILKDYRNLVFEKVKNKEQKEEISLIATMIAGQTLVANYIANIPENDKYFPENVKTQLKNFPWMVADDDNKKIVEKYLGLKKPEIQNVVLAPALNVKDTDVDYAASLFEINALDPFLLYQPVDSEYYGENTPLREGQKAYKAFMRRLFNYYSKNNKFEGLDGITNFKVKLLKKSELSASKIYGKLDSEYVFVLVDDKNEPITITYDGYITPEGSFNIVFESRVPDSLLFKINLSDEEILNGILEKGLVLNPNKYKESLYENAIRKDDTIAKEVIEKERINYKNELLEKTKNFISITEQLISSPTSYILINPDISRIGYLRYISEKVNQENTGSSYLTDEEGTVLNGVETVEYDAPEIKGALPHLIVNKEIWIPVYPSANNAEKNTRLQFIIDNIVDLLDPTLKNQAGVDINMTEKIEIFSQFFYPERFVKGNFKYSIQKGTFTLNTVQYDIKENAELFKENLKKIPFLNFTDTIKIPLVKNGVVDIIEISRNDFAKKYLKSAFTLIPGSNTLPLLNPVLALSDQVINPPEVKKISNVSFDRSKKAPSLTTDRVNKKALKWFNENPISKNMTLKQAFNIVNSKAFATWTRSGVTLFAGSSYADLYHEAWHEFTELYLTDEQRETLLNEVQAIKGDISILIDNEYKTKPAKDVTYAEAMEYLAEEFRTYGINESESKVSKIIKAIFKTIKKLINQLFGTTTPLDIIIDPLSSPVIKEMFENLYDGNLAEYKYFGEPSANQYFEKTIAGIKIKGQEKDTFTKEETAEVLEFITSSLFLNYNKAVTAANKDLLNPVDFKSVITSASAINNVVKERIKTLRNNYLTFLAEPTITEEYKSIYQNRLLFLDKIEKNLGDENRIRDNKENRGAIKFYVDNVKYLNEVYKANEEFENISMRDDGQYVDKGNNSTSILYDTDPYLKFLFSAMPVIKKLKNGTHYINKDLITIYKNGSSYYQIDQLGNKKELKKSEFDELFKKDESYIERNFLGNPKTQTDINYVINKIITTSESIEGEEYKLASHINPTQIFTALDKLKNINAFYSNLYNMLNIEALANVTSILAATKEDDKPKVIKALQNSFSTFMSFAQAYSRIEVPPLLLKIETKDGKFTIDVETSKTQHIQTWRNKEEAYNTLLLSTEDLTKRGIKKIEGNQIATFDVNTFYENNPIFMTEGVTRENVIPYLKLLGILEVETDYSRLTTELQKADIITGLTVFNNALKNQIDNDNFKVSNPVTLMKSGFEKIKDLKQYTFIQKIFDIINPLELNTNDFMYKNANGDLENEFSLISSVSRYFQIYNEYFLDEIGANFAGFNPTDLTADPFRRYSRLLYKIKNKNDGKLILYKAGGIRDNDLDKGVVESDGDMFTATLNGITLLLKNQSYRLSQHSGKNTQHYFKLGDKYFVNKNNSIKGMQNEYTDAMLEYLAAEAERVARANSGYYKGVKVISDYGKKYIYFSFLDKTIQEELTAIAKENLETPEKILSAIKSYTGIDEIKQKIVDELTQEVRHTEELFNKYNFDLETVAKALEYTSGIDNLLTFYITNKKISLIEMDILVYGDKANYVLNKDEFHKRNALFGSGGNVVFSDPSLQRIIKSLYSTEGPATDLQNLPVVILNDVIVESGSYDKLLEGVKMLIPTEEKAKKRAEPFTDMKEADAQGVINFDTYRAISIASSNWDDVKENMYQQIKAGKEVSINTTEFFPSLKYQYAGPAYYKDETGQKKEIKTFTLKFNIVPLIPSNYKTEDDKIYYDLVHEKMQNEGIGILTFISGSKNSFYFKDTNNFYNNEANLPSEAWVKNYINTIFFKDQLYIAPVYKGEAPISSQKRSKILDGLYENGEIKKEFKKYESIINDYKANITLATKIAKEKIQAKLNINLKNPSPEDIRKFADFVKNSLQTKGYLTQEETDFITVVGNKFPYDYASSGIADAIDGIIAGYIEKNVIYQKFPGEPLIQMASTGMEKVKNKRVLLESHNGVNKWLSNDLKFYEDGNPAQTKISLQGSFFNLLNLKHSDGEKIGTVNRLNEMMRNVEWKKQHKYKFIITGDRIPVHAHPSMEVLEIVEFFHPNRGNIIVLPSEIVAKSGGDFDVDKLTMLFPTITPEGELLEYTESYTDIVDKIGSLKKEINEIEIKVDEILASKKALTKEQKEYLKPLLKDLKSYTVDLKKQGNSLADAARIKSSKNVTELSSQDEDSQELFDSIVDDDLSDIQFIYDKIAEIQEKIKSNAKDLAEMPLSADVRKDRDNKIEKIEEALEELAYKKSNIIGAIGNRINKSVHDILLIPELYPMLIIPTAVDDLQAVAENNKKARELDMIVSTKENYSMVYNTIYDIAKLDQNGSGKDSLGIIAVLSSYFAELNQANFKLPLINTNTKKQVFIPFELNEIEEVVTIDTPVYDKTEKRSKILKVGYKVISINYGALTNLNNLSIADLHGQEINGAVDVEKDPWLASTGISKFTVSTQLALTSGGANVDISAKFLLNPLLIKYARLAKLKNSPWYKIFYGKPGYELSNTAILEQIYPAEEFYKTYKDYITNGQVWFTEEEIAKKWNNGLLLEANTILAAATNYKKYKGDIDFSDIEKQKEALIYYASITAFFEGTFNKIPFALRADRQRYTSFLDFKIFNKQFNDLKEAVPDETAQLLDKLKRVSIRSSFFISDGILESVYKTFSPDLLSIFDYIMEEKNKKVFFDNAGKLSKKFKDSKELVKTITNLYRSYLIQGVLNSRYNKEVYKGFTLVSTNTPVDETAINIILSQKSFTDILRSSIVFAKNDKGERVIFYNPLHIGVLSKSEVRNLNNLEFYERYKTVKIPSTGNLNSIISNEEYLKRYLIEHVIVEDKYPKAEFEKSTLFEKYLVKVPTNISEESKKDYAYKKFISDMAVLNSFSIKALSERGPNSIEKYLNTVKSLVTTDMYAKYPLINNIIANKQTFEKNKVGFEVINAKNSLDLFRTQAQLLVNPEKEKTGNKIDDMFIADVFTAIGLYSLMQSTTYRSTAMIQQMFVSKNLLSILDSIKLNANQLNSLLNKISIEVLGKDFLVYKSNRNNILENPVKVVTTGDVSINIAPYLSKNQPGISTIDITPTQPSANVNLLVEAGVKPTDMYGNAAKDIQMASESTQFIGFGTIMKAGIVSSTDKYAKAWGNKANTGVYTANDTVMVSGSGNFGRGGVDKKAEAEAIKKTLSEKYKPLLDKAIAAGASFRIGNQYSKGNLSDELVAKYLQKKGYIEEKLDGYSRWISSTAQPITQQSTSVKPTVKDLNKWADIKDATTPYTDKGIVVTRISNTTKTYSGKVNSLQPNQVFVFGSNPLGINGNPAKGTGGAALVAYNIAGVKQGEKMDNRISDSGKAWGLTTVTAPGNKRSMTFEQITEGIKKLYEYAKQNPNKEFLVSDYSSTNLNGYSGQEMADMFVAAGPIPNNIVFNKNFAELISNKHFGNPFIGSKRRDKQGNLVESKVDNITVFNTIDEADQAYRDWLMGTKHQNIQQERREWILKQINEGKLDGKTLLYYKPMEVQNNDGTIVRGGYHSHADTLAEIVEQLRGVQSFTQPSAQAVSQTRTFKDEEYHQAYVKGGLAAVQELIQKNKQKEISAAKQLSKEVDMLTEFEDLNTKPNKTNSDNDRLIDLYVMLKNSKELDFDYSLNELGLSTQPSAQAVSKTVVAPSKVELPGLLYPTKALVNILVEEIKKKETKEDRISERDRLYKIYYNKLISGLSRIPEGVKIGSINKLQFNEITLPSDLMEKEVYMDLMYLFASAVYSKTGVMDETFKKIQFLPRQIRIMSVMETIKNSGISEEEIQKMINFINKNC